MPILPGRGRALGPAAAVLALTLLPSCSGTAPVAGGGLHDGLTRVSSDGWSSVTVGDHARLRRLSEEEPERYRSVMGMGGPLLTSYAGPRRGVDPEKVERSIWVAGEVQAGVLVGGIDGAALHKYLTADGYTEQEVDGRSALIKDGGDAYRVDGGELRYAAGGKAAAGLAAVHPESGKSLADREEVRWAVDCLGGTPYRIDLVNQENKDNVKLIAVGQFAKDPAKPYEVICGATRTEAGAEKAAATVREEIADDPEEFPGATVETDGSGFRARVPAEGEHRPGRTLTDLTLLLRLVLAG